MINLGETVERQDRKSRPSDAAEAINRKLASEAKAGVNSGTSDHIRKAEVVRATDNNQKILVCDSARSE